jgi:transposase-like protein
VICCIINPDAGQAGTGCNIVYSFGISCKREERGGSPMVIHKRTRLTPLQREEIYRVYHGEGKKISELAEAYHVSRPTIYKIIQRGRQRDFAIHPSTNKRFRCLKYGIKRLSKIEEAI